MHLAQRSPIGYSVGTKQNTIMLLSKYDIKSILILENIIQLIETS